MVCPSCGKQFRQRFGGFEARFFYGQVNCWYELGDSVNWLYDRSKKLAPAFTLIDRERTFMDRIFEWIGPTETWNYGSPDYARLIVLDYESPYGPARAILRCCGTPIEAGIIEIENNILVNYRWSAKGGLEELVGSPPGDFEIAFQKEDGKWWPRRDWFAQNNEPLVDLRKK
jgi:hypothetical protein